MVGGCGTGTAGCAGAGEPSLFNISTRVVPCGYAEATGSADGDGELSATAGQEAGVEAAAPAWLAVGARAQLDWLAGGDESDACLKKSTSDCDG